jgi:hypothetical protein
MLAMNVARALLLLVLAVQTACAASSSSTVRHRDLGGRVPSLFEPPVAGSSAREQPAYEPPALPRAEPSFSPPVSMRLLDDCSRCSGR